MVAQWYTVFSKPRKEIQVANYMVANKLEVYCPTLRVNPVNPRAAKTRPYFPRYLFARADIECVGKGALQWIPGAVGLVSFDGEPVSIPDLYIEELKQRVAELDAESTPGKVKFRRGDAVCINEGPFAGFEAIFDMRLDDDKRVQVLLHWLGREVRTTISNHAITKRQSR